MNGLVTGDIVGFKGFLRMTPDVFNELLAKIDPHVRRCDTNMRDSVTPHEKLVVTLRYLATGRTRPILHFVMVPKVTQTLGAHRAYLILELFLTS